jgi:hypothetical protein
MVSMASDDDPDDEGYWMAAGDPAPGSKPPVPKPKKFHAVLSRVPVEIYAKLQKVAERDAHSVSMYVARLIIKDMSKKRIG